MGGWATGWWVGPMVPGCAEEIPEPGCGASTGAAKATRQGQRWGLAVGSMRSVSPCGVGWMGQHCRCECGGWAGWGHEGGQWVSSEQPSERGAERWRCLRGMLRPELPGARPLAQAAQQQTGLVGWGQHHSWSRRASATGAGGPQAEQEGHCGAGWPGEASSKHLNESDGACARSGEGDGWGWCRCGGAATGVAHT